MGCSHPRLDGCEGMFNGLAPDRHGIADCLHPYAERFDEAFMLPASEAALFTGGALIFQRTGLAFARPVKGYRQAIFLSVKAVDEDLASRAAIFVRVGQIDKILLAEAACGFRS